MSTVRGNRVGAAVGTVPLTGAAMGFLAGCETGPSDAERVYCVDGQNHVVGEDQCREAANNGGFVGGVPFFFLVGGFGGHSYSPGQRIPSQYTGAATRVSPSDGVARARAGLPRTGTVTSGSRISGGIGSGRVGGAGS